MLQVYYLNVNLRSVLGRRFLLLEGVALRQLLFGLFGYESSEIIINLIRKREGGARYFKMH